MVCEVPVGFDFEGRKEKEPERIPTSSSISVSSIQFFNVNALALRYHTACALDR